MKHKYRSDLSKAKNLGSAGSGSHHWWHQRFTALLMSVMVVWFFSFWQISKSEVSIIITCLQKPYNVVMLVIFFVAMMYHAVLGMQVIIEDYITCRTTRLLSLLGTQLFAIVTTISFLVAVFYIIIL